MYQNARILVVDDNALLRNGVSTLLQNENWNVCGEAENGKQAIEKVLALKPDLVLMDLNMPVMNGVEATKQIRRLAPSTKIVVLSMHKSQEIETQAKGAGAEAYVNKSTPFEDLSRVIRQMLGSNRPNPE